MNKKIILSAAAAATIALVITGCGSSDSSSSGSSLSGSAVKGDLNNSLVTVGGVTTRTNSDGTWSVGDVPAGTSATITGGNWNDGYINGVAHYTDNNVTLSASPAQLSAGMEAAMLSTLTNYFDGNMTKAGNALGLTIAPGQTIAQVARQFKAADYEKGAVQIAAVLGSATNLTQTLASLEGNATNGKVSVATLKLIAPSMSTALDYMEAGNYVAGNLLATGTNTAAEVAAMDFGANNVINVDANDTNGSFATNDGGTTLLALPYSDGNFSSSSTLMDNNATAVMFKMTDYNATLTNVNNNTSLFVKLAGLDTANANNSYVMGLTGMATTGSANGPLALYLNTNATLTTYANSNVSYTVSADSNATVLQGSSNFLSTSSNYNVINVARFKKYMDSIYAAEDANTSTVGNFTTGMNSGNFSLKVYVNVADQNMTYNDRVTKIVGTSMSKTTNDTGATLFSGTKAYKVLDTNLSY